MSQWNPADGQSLLAQVVRYSPTQLTTTCVNAYRHEFAGGLLSKISQVAPFNCWSHDSRERKPEPRLDRVAQNERRLSIAREASSADLPVYSAEIVWRRDGHLVKNLELGVVGSGKKVRTIFADLLALRLQDKANRRFEADMPKQLRETYSTYTSARECIACGTGVFVR